MTKPLVAMVGFEPTNKGVKVPCLASWLHRYIVGSLAHYQYTNLRQVQLTFFQVGNPPGAHIRRRSDHLPFSLQREHNAQARTAW